MNAKIITKINPNYQASKDKYMLRNSRALDYITADRSNRYLNILEMHPAFSQSKRFNQYNHLIQRYIGMRVEVE